MITLHAFGNVHPLVHGLTRDLRVQWALEELELPYRVKGLDHTAGETKTEAFREMSPFLQLPLIDDDGFVLTETGAILLYLAEKAGELPKDAQGRATVTRWCFVALTTVEPLIQTINLMDFQAGADEGAKRQREAMVKLTERSLTGLDLLFAKREYIAGADFTVADILLTTVLRSARRANLLGPYPRVEAYRAHCESRPAWQRTLDAYATRLGADRAALA